MCRWQYRDAEALFLTAIIVGITILDTTSKPPIKAIHAWEWDLNSCVVLTRDPMGLCHSWIQKKFQLWSYRREAVQKAATARQFSLYLLRLHIPRAGWRLMFSSHILICMLTRNQVGAGCGWIQVTSSQLSCSEEWRRVRHGHHYAKFLSGPP